MSKRATYIYIGGIAILLLLLIVIQIIWVNRTADADKRETQLQVHRALKEVEKKMTDSYSCFEFFTKTHLDANEGVFLLKQQWEDGKYTGSVDTVSLYYDYYEFKNNLPRKAVPYRFSNYHTDVPTYAEVSIRFIYELADTVAFNREKVLSNELSRANFRELSYDLRPLTAVFDMEDVDSMINAALIAEGIHSPNGFGFFETGTKNLTFAKNIRDTAALRSSPYNAQLFNGDKFLKPYTLAIIFPAAGTHMNGWMLLSAAVIILLTLAFFFFIRTHMQQARLSGMKTDFINNLTHEMNTPMANIALAIETLEDNESRTPKVNHLLHIITAESLRLRENIERALQVASMEKNNLRMRKEEVNLAALIETIETSYRAQCEQYGGNITFTHTGDTTVFGDETHLLNSVCNLLDNAIKYRNGPPVIHISLDGKDTQVIFKVTDNGRGIPADLQKHVFEKFYRAEQGSIRNTKGFGLGLSYVKGIVEHHKGKINVWSKPGTGTTFTITLPKQNK